MAVITQINLHQAQSLCEKLNINVKSLKGIVAGTENSTFLIEDADDKKYILTLFEQGGLEDINFVCNLQYFLNSKNLPVLVPKRHKNGDFYALLENKPCLVFDFAKGEPIVSINAQSAIEAAIYIAKQHQLTANYKEEKPHQRYISYVQKNRLALRPFLSKDEQKMLDEELEIYEKHLVNSDLPKAVLHGDLFRDNVFFEQKTRENSNENRKISAVIDFYNSCTGVRIYDLAVLVSDWSFDEKGNFDEIIYKEILKAYQSVINFTDAEKKSWHYMLRLVASRYWISRLLVVHLEEKSDRVAKDPNHFKKILVSFRKMTAP